MSDDRRELWEELMRSPLDEERRGLPSWVAPLAVGLLAAAAAFAVVWLVRDGGGEATAAATTTTTQPPRDDGPVYPAGYTEVGDGVAARIIAVYERPTTISVLIGTVAAAGLDRSAVPVVEAGWWETLPDRGPPLRETKDQLAVGFVTVEFPRSGSGIPTAVGFSPVADRETGIVEWTDAALPSTAAPSGYAFSDHSLVFDRVDLEAAWGLVAWHLEGEGRARARITTDVTLVGTDDPATEEADPTALRSRHIAPQYPSQLHRPGTPTYDRQGSDQLVPVGEPVTESNAASGVEAVIDVELVVPSDDRVEIPVGEVLVIIAR